MKSTLDPHERSLVERCLSGDNRAWAEFFEAHYRIISSVVRWKKWGFEAHELEDITQEILEQVTTSMRRFNFQSALTSFVYKIAANSCVNRLRHRTAIKRGANIEKVVLDPIGGEPREAGAHVPVSKDRNPEQILLDRENLHWVKKALGALDKRCKELIRLRYFEELSFKEIGKRLKARENTLVVHLNRCIHRLSQYVQAEAEIG